MPSPLQVYMVCLDCSNPLEESQEQVFEPNKNLQVLMKSLCQQQVWIGSLASSTVAASAWHFGAKTFLQ